MGCHQGVCKVTVQKKAHGEVWTLLQITPCTDWHGGCRVFLSKQLHPAMTTSLYTKPIERRKPIDFINALVSFQSHFQERCKQDYVTGRILFVQYGQSAYLTKRLDVGLMDTPKSIRASGTRKMLPDTDWNETRELPSYSRYVSIGSLPLL